MRQSTVLLIPYEHCALLCQYLEAHGWGPGNLRVELHHIDGTQWCGGHLHLGPDWLALLQTPAPIEGDMTDYTPALTALVIYQGDRDERGNLISASPSALFDQALVLNGLSKVEP